MREIYAARGIFLITLMYSGLLAVGMALWILASYLLFREVPEDAVLIYFTSAAAWSLADFIIYYGLRYEMMRRDK